MSEAGRKTSSPHHSDALLWLGGAIIVGLGITWLLLSKPWGGSGADDLGLTAAETGTDTMEPVLGTSSSPTEDATTSSQAATPVAGGQAARADLATPLEHNPLRMAELAYDAGMLVEPEEYSAWTLYARALEQDSNSEAARQGLEKIADELLARANVAVEQGRFEDALATIERIRTAIPAHPGANDLAFTIDELRPDPEPEPIEARAEPEADEAEPAQAPAPVARRDVPKVDPLLAAHESFSDALTQNHLLTPADSSAKHFLDLMIELDADHELTQEAKLRFSDELLLRASAAIVELDAPAAETWLDEAERLGVGLDSVALSRERLRSRLIQVESERLVPVSALVIERYVPPSYPKRALERSLEGWVDIEFIVTPDGTTRDVTVTDASHTDFFREEAIEAIEQWRVRPRTFMGELIEQRSRTRIRFTLEE